MEVVIERVGVGYQVGFYEGVGGERIEEKKSKKVKKGRGA